MNIRKITILLLVVLLAVNLLLTASALAAVPGMLPTNHYMAKNISLASGDSSVADGTLPGIVVKPGMPVTLKTFDQFTCFAGNHELVLRIVKHDNGYVVASTNPITFKATHDGFVFTQPTAWNIQFPAIGWYRHEVIADGAPIAYYHFIVSFTL